jgi:2-polyprenyl-3-methyl-5-hydroxy-6-metoxy-1,4-benzoquinol methylase
MVPAMLSPDEDLIGRYYDEDIYEAELQRLPRDFPIEREITKRMLARWIPRGSRVAEIGVGGGHYTEWLLQRGCRVHLVDISRRLLETVAAKIRSGLLGVTRASATNLSELRSGTFDVVLLLGPLYHLLAREERRRAVAEPARLLKQGGILFAAGINRLSYLRALFHDAPDEVLKRKEFHRRHLRDGNLDPKHAPPIGYAHLTSIEEFRELFRNSFQELALLGVESFAATWQRTLNDLEPRVAAAWLDLVEKTGPTLEGLAQSDHILFIGRRKAGRKRAGSSARNEGKA